MAAEIRITLYGMRVLKTFADKPGEDFSGADIALKNNLTPGTLYPLLARLEATGLLKSRWEKGSPKALKRPLKHFYRITEAGKQRFLFEKSRKGY